MVQDQGINVYVVRCNDDNLCREYPVPASSPTFTGDLNQVYIEAVEGERFVIIADTYNKSDTKGSERLKISCEVDPGNDSTGPWRCGFVRPPNDPSKPTLKGRYFHLSELQIRAPSGRYVLHPLSIGSRTYFLIGDEELSQDEVERSVADYGNIVVKMWRSSLRKSASRLVKAYEPNDTTVSSKAVVQDNHVSYTIW